MVYIWECVYISRVPLVFHNTMPYSTNKSRKWGDRENPLKFPDYSKSTSHIPLSSPNMKKITKQTEISWWGSCKSTDNLANIFLKSYCDKMDWKGIVATRIHKWNASHWKSFFAHIVIYSFWINRPRKAPQAPTKYSKTIGSQWCLKV